MYSWCTLPFRWFFSSFNKKTKGCCYSSSHHTHSLVGCEWQVKGFVSMDNHEQLHRQGAVVHGSSNSCRTYPLNLPSALTPAQGARATGWRFLQFYFHRLSLGTRLEFCHISCSWGCHYWLSCFHTFWHGNTGGCRSQGWPILCCLQKSHTEREMTWTEDFLFSHILIYYTFYSFFIYYSRNNVLNHAYQQVNVHIWNVSAANTTRAGLKVENQS